MSTTPVRMTVEEFRQLREPPGCRLELHNGEVISSTFPKMGHWRTQERIRQILEEALGERGKAVFAFGFRPLPEHELWQADVAWISGERFRNIDYEDYLAGAPDIVVEVLSPSNTASQMLERMTMRLDNGCGEFWVIDHRKGLIVITRGEDSKSVRYKAGESLQVGQNSYAVNDILDGARER